MVLGIMRRVDLFEGEDGTRVREKRELSGEV